MMIYASRFILIVLLCCISVLTSPRMFGQEVTATVIDKHFIFKNWFIEGLKLNDEPNFGGYERIDLVTYSSQGDSTTDIRKIKYQVQGLLGLKFIRAQVLVNLGFPDYGLLLEYSWTNSPVTPRDYFKTVEILQLEKDTVVSVWKYNTEEDGSRKGKTVFAHIDFMQTSANKTWDIIVNRSEGHGRDIRKYKNMREIYRYKKDGTFHLVKTESVTIKE